MKLVSVIRMCLNKTYTIVCIGKHLSDTFPIQNGLQQDALMPLLLTFFKICHQESPRKPGGTETEWDSSGLC
jgi:hypothetical protein